MLCQFTFKNYKSYRDETILDMQAVSSQGFEHSLLPDGNKQELLPVAAIYGPNAGGKSNVLDALKCLHSLVVFPILLFRGQTNSQAVNCVPFLFDEKTPEEPTEFEIFFIPNAEFEYRYQISVQKGKIVEENLYRRKLAPNSRISTLFERSDGEIKLAQATPYMKIIHIHRNNKNSICVFYSCQNIKTISYVVNQHRDDSDIFKCCSIDRPSR